MQSADPSTSQDADEDRSDVRFSRATGIRSPRGWAGLIQAPTALETDFSEPEAVVPLADAALAALRLDSHARKDVDIVAIGDWLMQVSWCCRV